MTMMGSGGGCGSASAARVLGAGRALLWRMVQDAQQRQRQQHQPAALLQLKAALTTSSPAAMTAAAPPPPPPPPPPSSSSSAAEQNKSVDAREARKFGALADRWWDVESGPFAALHSMNPARVAFIRDAVLEARREASALAEEGASSSTTTPTPPTPTPSEPLAGLRVLDVGCGGGILAEPLARLGARVLGIDAAREGVLAARAHSSLDPRVKERTRYRAATAERLLDELLTGAPTGHQEQDENNNNNNNNNSDEDDDDLETSPYCRSHFDVVIASEVIEHVRDPPAFLATLASLAHPQHGTVIISTLNRTPKSLALAVVGAERVAGLVPVGTHDWRRFLTPQELAMMAESSGLEVFLMAGMVPDLRAGVGALGRVATGRSGGGGAGGRRGGGSASAAASLAGALLSKWRLSSTDLGINYIALLRRRR